MPSSIAFWRIKHTGGAVIDHLTERIADFQQLVDAFAALVARVVADVAALPK